MYNNKTITIYRLDGTVVEVPSWESCEEPLPFSRYMYINTPTKTLEIERISVKDFHYYDVPLFNRIRLKVMAEYPGPEVYHGYDHIETLLIKFNQYWDKFKKTEPDWWEGHNNPDRAKELCLLAILSHDIVYVVGAKDNEKRSADKALDYLKDDLPPDELDIIKKHILYTEMDAVEGLPTSKFIRDLDWLSFSDMTIFMGNEPSLLEEAIRAGYSYWDFIEGRKKFLGWLYKDKPVIFRTRMFEHLNKAAEAVIEERYRKLLAGA